jgi:hypothetical protein
MRLSTDGAIGGEEKLIASAVCRLATRSWNAFRIEARVTQLIADAAMEVG